eukprot:4830513-Pleurochrysis_carterae.AAC.1
MGKVAAWRLLAFGKIASARVLSLSGLAACARCLESLRRDPESRIWIGRGDAIASCIHRCRLRHSAYALFGVALRDLSLLPSL